MSFYLFPKIFENFLRPVSDKNFILNIIRYLRSFLVGTIYSGKFPTYSVQQ